jgi:hypothetical protein
MQHFQPVEGANALGDLLDFRLWEAVMINDVESATVEDDRGQRAGLSLTCDES